MRLTIALVVCLLMAACDFTAPANGPLRGTWGAGHEGAAVQFVATDSGATLSHICAVASTKTPIRVDASGRFSVPGLSSRVGGPPPQPFEQPLPVFLVGERLPPDDRFLVVSVRFSPEDSQAPAFLLRRGNRVEVLNCP